MLVHSLHAPLYLYLASLPKMCNITTAPMNARDSTSTVVGPLHSQYAQNSHTPEQKRRQSAAANNDGCGLLSAVDCCLCCGVVLV